MILGSNNGNGYREKLQNENVQATSTDDRQTLQLVEWRAVQANWN